MTIAAACSVSADLARRGGDRVGGGRLGLGVVGVHDRGGRCGRCSTAAMMRSIIATASTRIGAARRSRPRASPRRRRRRPRSRRRTPRRASAPARSTIDSSIWVATTTGLPAAARRADDALLQAGTSSGGSSTPRSPRATITASDELDDLVEPLDRRGLLDLGHARRRGRRSGVAASAMSSGRCTKDSAIQSAPSVEREVRGRGGPSRSAPRAAARTPGRLTPLRSDERAAGHDRGLGEIGAARLDLAAASCRRRAAGRCRPRVPANTSGWGRARGRSPGARSRSRRKGSPAASLIGRPRTRRRGSWGPAGRPGCRSAGRARVRARGSPRTAP